MSRPRQFFTPPRDSHLIGLLIAVPAYMMMVDVAAVAATIPGCLGFGWLADFVGASPLACIFVCLAISILAPVGNDSRSALVRAIGRIPVLARYLVSVGLGFGTLLLGLVALHFLTSSSIQSLQLRGDVPSETVVRIYAEVGDGVVFRWSGDEVQVFFREENRRAVERALADEGIEVGE